MEYDLRLARNGAKLYYHNGKRIAKEKVPEYIRSQLLDKQKQSNKSEPEYKPKIFTLYLDTLSSDLKCELCLYLDPETYQLLMKYDDWKFVENNKFFLLKKVYNNLLIPQDVLRKTEDLESLQILAKRPPLNKNESLYNCAIYGNLDELRLLLQAVPKNNENSSKFLDLNNKIDVDGVFSCAVAYGQLDIVEWLICQEHVNINNGIKLALAYRNYNIAKFLLIEYKDQIAIESLIEKIIRSNEISLVSKVVDFFQINFNAGLYMAATFSTVEIVSYLIKCGATNLDSALATARFHKNNDVIEYLIKLTDKHST